MPDVSQYFVACAFILSYLERQTVWNWSTLGNWSNWSNWSAQIKSLDHSSVRFGNKITCRKMLDFNSEKM